MCITYGRLDLLQIRQNVTSSKGLKLLSLDTVKVIRRNRLNKRGKRAGNTQNIQKYQDININTSACGLLTDGNSKQNTGTNIRLLLINAQSIKNKDILIAEYIHDLNIDVCVVTETWLAKNSDEVDAWINTYELTKHGYCIDAVSRESKGGGLALIYRKQYQVKKLSECELQSLQFAKWSVAFPQKWSHLMQYTIPHIQLNIR